MPVQSQAHIVQALQTCRQQTLEQIAGIQPELFSKQSHPNFSPVGWHLGHIAFTESLWITETLAGLPCPFRQYNQLFSADGLPKEQRQNLPTLETILSYMASVREHTLSYLENNDALSAEASRLWHWLIQHESQHRETIAMVLLMHQQQGKKTPLATFWVQQVEPVESCQKTAQPEMLLVESGDFLQGCDAPEAIDNERPAHSVWLERYWIDSTPITCGQYRQFIEAGGYQKATWWTAAGWQWQQRSQLTHPLYWQEDVAWESHPVCGISWYEANAYARFVGKRLPSEAEWEKAALIHGFKQMLSGVWEWTDSWFEGYPGFQPFPYDGYSQAYFDGEHRVLKGGSWATSLPLLRRSFRNWYHPHRRELFSGFRCAA